MIQVNTQEWYHFASTASGVLIGSIPGASIIIVFIWRVMRKLDIFMVEHEMLIIDYAKSRNMKVSDLPTRSGRFRNGG